MQPQVINFTVDVLLNITGMWKPVVRGVLIPVNLETSYLHVKTNSALGSNDWIEIVYRDNERREAGGICIWFTSTRVVYSLLNCDTGFHTFSPYLPTELEKLWTIEKRGYRTRVICNIQPVLNISVSNVICNEDDWETYWSREVSEIEFLGWGNSSEAYHIGKLSQLLLFTVTSDCSDD
jgi:hypothetical protein